MIAGAVFDNLVGSRAKGIVEVLEMGLANVFNAKIINGKSKPHQTGVMLPETGNVGLFVVSVACEEFSEEFVCEDAGLWETIHSFAYLHIDVTPLSAFSRSP